MTPTQVNEQITKMLNIDSSCTTAINIKIRPNEYPTIFIKAIINKKVKSIKGTLKFIEDMEE